jgi:hypothetical protein
VTPAALQIAVVSSSALRTTVSEMLGVASTISVSAEEALSAVSPLDVQLNIDINASATMIE